MPKLSQLPRAASTNPSDFLLALRSGQDIMVPAPQNAFLTGNQNPVSGGVMQIDNLLQTAPNFPMLNEGFIWTSTAYAFCGIAKEVNAATVPGQGFSGPLVSLFAYIANNGAVAPAVALIADAVGQTANCTVFAANFIARNGAVNGVKLCGLEIDIEPAVGTTVNANSIGLAINIFSINAADPTPVCQVGSVGGGIWGNGFLTSHINGAHYAVVSGDPVTSKWFINTVNGSFSLGAIALGTGASQGIIFGGGAFGTSPYMYGDSAGDLLVNMGTNGFVIFAEPGGAQRFTFSKFGGLNMPNNGNVQINSVQVLQQQVPGYGTPTGGSRISNFPGATATLLQTSEMLAQLMLDLKLHGMIGA